MLIQNRKYFFFGWDKYILCHTTVEVECKKLHYMVVADKVEYPSVPGCKGFMLIAKRLCIHFCYK